MKTKDFSYYLPKELIAQKPAPEREASKLMVLERENKEIRIEASFRNILQFLEAGDLLVGNDSPVIPARLIGKRADSGGKVEILLLGNRKGCFYEALSRPSKRLSKGSELVFGDNPLLKAKIVEKGISSGHCWLEFEPNGGLLSFLDKYGQVPLPPYIKRLKEKGPTAEDLVRYQTIYADKSRDFERCSVAAPTAGLHFSEYLMDQIKIKGLEIVYITLQVSWGTFQPIRSENLEEHNMETEKFTISEDTAKKINQAKQEGRRIIAIGTTTVRGLESCSYKDSNLIAGDYQTSLFIKPGYQFKIIDALITNFHLPYSSLLVLVAAFAGLELIKKAYQTAIGENMRFYSYGDAMLII